MKKRDIVFDLIKLYSMLMVITHHFMVEYLKYESIPLKIVNGKFGVQLFAVILGIFAYKSGNKNKEDSLHYAVRRYSYFLICEFVINSLYYCFNINGSRMRMSFGYVIGQSLILGDDIFPTIWFAKEFLVGSVLCFLIGKKDFGKKDVLIAAACLGIISEPFVGTCVMGCLAEMLIDEDRILFNNRLSCICVILISLFVRIILSKSSLTYFIFGICSTLEIIAIKKSRLFSNIPFQRIISYLGSITMPMLLIHPCLIGLVNSMNFFQNQIITAAIRYIILLALVLISSVLLDVVIRVLVKLENDVIDFVFDKVSHLILKND